MNLKEKIESDFLEAVKAKDQIMVSVLRLLKSAIKNEEIKQIKKLDNRETEKVIRREVKQRNDSIVEYEKGGREDLASKEKSEIDILKEYLPEAMPEEEVKKIIEGVAAKMGEIGPDDFGKVMGVAMKEIAGRADGDIVGNIVKELLEPVK